MSKFKVGDKVTVRSDLNKTDKYYNEDKETWDNCVSEMLDLRGKTVTIKGVNRTGKYRICEDGYSWTDEMFAEPRREFIVIRRDGAKTIAELRHDREVMKSAVATCSEKDPFDFNTGAKLAFDRLMGREEPAPAPQPAHRFKVGDRVFIDPLGIFGTVVLVDEADTDMPYHVKHDHNSYWWAKEYQLSPAPAPEPPKYYTGKVVCIRGNGDDTGDKTGKIASVKDGYCDYDRWNKANGLPYVSFGEFCTSNDHIRFIEIKE